MSVSSTLTDAAVVADAAVLMVSTTRGALQAAVAVVGQVPFLRSMPPVLAYTLVRVTGSVLTLSRTNYDTSVTARLTVNNPAGVDGEFLVSQPELAGHLAASAKGETKRAADAAVVSILFDGEKPVLRVAGFDLPLESRPTGEYPTLPLAPVGGFHVVDRVAFTSMVTRVLTAVGTDQLVPVFTAVSLQLDDTSAVLRCTDRFRMTCGTVPATGSGIVDVLAPGKDLSAALRRFTGDKLSVAMDGQYLFLICGDTTISLRLIIGDYPKVQHLMNTSKLAVKVTVDRVAFIKAARKAAAIAAGGEKNVCRVLLNVGPTSVALLPMLDDTRIATAGPHLEAQADSLPFEGLQLGLNPHYFTDMLDTFPTGDTLELHAVASGKPVMFTDADNPDFAHLIMTMTAPR